MQGTALAEYRFEWDFNAKVWEGTIQVGEATVQSTRYSPDILRKGLREKLEAMSLAQGLSGKSAVVFRKQAAK